MKSKRQKSITAAGAAVAAAEQPKPADPETDRPKWIGTPYPTYYMFGMWAGGGDPMQQLDINREEYIALKRELARVRGMGDIPAKDFEVEIDPCPFGQ